MKGILALAGGVLIVFASTTSVSADEQDLADGHPRPSYAGYSDAEIGALAKAVRKSRPQMHRGGWEWDRLLSRYVDGGRKEKNALGILHAYFLSILDRYEEAETAGDGDAFNLFPGHGAWGSGGRMRIYEELVRRNMLSRKQQSTFKNIVNQSLKLSFDYANIERGVNNRPYGMNGGPAIAVRIFPDMPNAAKHRRWLNVLWRELTEYGDTTETNYYPYGPLYLHGLLDMAEGMGKFETQRDFLYAHARRYLDYVHGGGVRGNPNSGAGVIRDRTQTYADPWNAEYYAGAEKVNDGHVWYRLARHFKDPEFLWASEQVCLGGRPPQGHRIPSEYLKAYNRRYAWFVQRGIEPKVPPSRSKIGYYSPLKYKVPERLYLCPGRESGKPFVSYYIYDRNNNYMHYNDDIMGHLYEYAVDGVKYLHSSGKYNMMHNGPTSYDALWVQHPAVDFARGKAFDIPYGTWNTASMPLPGTLNSRTAADSKNWFRDEEIGLYRRTDDPQSGYAYGNMDGYWYLNNKFHLKSIEFTLVDPVVELQNLRLSGPKGDLPINSSDKMAKSLKIIATPKDGDGKPIVWTGGDEFNEVVSLVDGKPNTDGKPAPALGIRCQEGFNYSVSLAGIDLRFDAQNEYTRVLLDHNGRITAGAFSGSRGRPAGFTLNGLSDYLTHDSRGGILVRESLRAENRGDDSFGQFTMRNFGGPRSRWTRQTVLTEEGWLIVRDVFAPGKHVNGYQAGPCWQLAAVSGEAKEHPKDRNWFDAPARDYAWWQTAKRRVMLYIHPGEGLTYGAARMSESQDIRGKGVNDLMDCSYGRAILQAGRPQVFLSVLVPHNAEEETEKVVQRIKTRVDDAGNCTAGIGNMKVTINADGQWSVKR